MKVTKTIGILGGMGPMATIDVLQKIIRYTEAKKDQDHHHIVINCNPKIPSRVDAIMNRGESPLPALIQSAKVLEMAGADFIIMPCHTAHYWYEQVQKEVNIPIYHMIENTVTSIFNRAQIPNSILLLATSATVHTELFQKAFQTKRIHLRIPSKTEQHIISWAIDDVKAGFIHQNRYLEDLNGIIINYAALGVDSVLAGCTEISLLYPFMVDFCEKIDSSQLLAEMVIKKVNER